MIFSWMVKREVSLKSFPEKFPRESAEEANFLSEFQDPLTSSVN